MILTLTVNNWAKYNPRSDVKSCSWFRMSNDFFSDAEFYKATPCMRLVWIFIMCAASKKMDPTIKINLNMVSDQVTFTNDEVLNALDTLVQIGCLESDHAHLKSTRSNPIESPMLLSATNERTNEQTDSVVVSGVTGSPESTGDESSDIKPRAVIEMLNQICGRQFKVTSKASITLARARLREGWSLSDFKTVFEFKAAEWSGDPKMAQYLQPSTLLGSKFEGYLQAAANGAAEIDHEQILKDSLDAQILAAGLNLPMKKPGAR